MNIRKKAIFSLTFVALGYSLLSVAVRLLDKGFEPLTQGYLRLGLGFVVATLILRKNISWKNITHLTKPSWLLIFSMASIGYAVGVYFINLGAVITNLLNISVIYGTIPFFVYFYSLLLHKKRADPKILLTLLISLYGVSVIASKSFFPSFSAFGKGEFFVLLSAASFAWFYAARKFLPTNLTNSEITVLTMPIAFVVLFLAAILTGEHFYFRNLFTLDTLMGLVIGAGFNIVSSLFTSFSFQNLEAHFASQILLLENVFSPIIGLTFYGERLDQIIVFGALIVVFCIIISNYLLTD